jgi:hypothetical protein
MARVHLIVGIEAMVMAAMAATLLTQRENRAAVTGVACVLIVFAALATAAAASKRAVLGPIVRFAGVGGSLGQGGGGPPLPPPPPGALRGRGGGEPRYDPKGGACRPSRTALPNGGARGFRHCLAFCDRDGFAARRAICRRSRRAMRRRAARREAVR